MNLFEKIIIGLDNELIKPTWKTLEFAAGFDKTVHELSDMYRLGDGVFSQKNAILRDGLATSNKSKSDTIIPDSINTLRSFLDYVKFNRSSAENMFTSNVKMGSVEITSSKLVNGDDFKGGYLGDAVSNLAHKAAKLEMLLQGGDKGIPDIYSTATVQARKELAIMRDAAKLAYNWDPSWGRLNAETAIKKAQGRLTKAMVKKGMVVGALGLASCMLPTKDYKPPATIADGGGGVATAIASEEAELGGSSVEKIETPMPGSETESLEPAFPERMSVERMVELENQYHTGQVFGYNEAFKDNKVKTLSADEKAPKKVWAGYTLTINGVKNEYIVMTDLHRVHVNGEEMTELLQLQETDQNGVEYMMFGEFGAGSNWKDLEYPVDQNVQNGGFFIPWNVEDKNGNSWTFVDGKLHPVQLGGAFKSAIPLEFYDIYDAASQLSEEYGEFTPDRTDDGQAQIIFDNGMKFNWVDGKLVQVVEFAPEVDAIIADEKTPEEVRAFLTDAKEGGLAATTENGMVKIEGDLFVDPITGKTERTYSFTLPDDGRVIQLTTSGQVGVDVTIGVDANGNTVVTIEGARYSKENGWTQARALAPDGITETEHPALSKDEFEVMVLAETLKVTEPNWEDPNSATRKESKQRSDELTDGKGVPRRTYEGVEYFVGGGVYDSRVYIVDENGIPVRAENGKIVEIPTVFHTSLNMTQTGQTLGALEINGVATKFVIDAPIGEFADYKKKGVTSWTMTQAEYDAVMSALTPAN